MPSNIKMALVAAKLSIIGLIILELLWYGLELVPSLSFLAGDYLYIVKLGLFLFAGYSAAKLSGFNIQIALLAGAFAGIAVEIIDLLLSSILYPGSYDLSYWVGDFIEWTVIAALVALGGHFLASYREEKPKSQETSSQPREENDQNVSG